MRAVALVVALLCFGAGAWLSSHYPLYPTLLLVGFVLWTAVVFLRPSFWLFALPALLPVTGLASWTGWLIFEELDIIVLGSAAGGYARIAAGYAASLSSQRRVPRVSLVVVGWILLFAVSTAIALYRGIIDAGGLRFDWFQGYEHALNSVRLGKSFPLAVLLLPLVLVQMRRSGEQATDLLGIGLATGLLGVSVTILWERLAFPGLLDFSPDYRATALFWEMHVGGAALDGFLALTVPFALREFVRAATPPRWVLAAALIAVATYACLMTFSRGVYLAVPLSLALLALLLSRQNATRPVPSVLGASLGLAAFVAIVATASYLVFREGGYRTLAAVLGALAVTLAVGAAARKLGLSGWSIALGLGGFLGIGSIAAGTLLPKAPYITYAIAFFACATLIWAERQKGGHLAAVALGTYVWVLIAAAWVAWHWGGESALRDAAIVGVTLLVLTAWNARRASPLWTPTPRGQTGILGSAALIAAATAVLSGGAYMVDRFSTSERDLTDRLQHWRDGLGLLTSPADWTLGKGLGRFPASYLFGVKGNEFPGTYSLLGEGGNPYLTLSGPRHALGFHQLFRMSQRVAVAPGAAYSISLDTRSAHEVILHVEICEKHLLYPAGCAVAEANIAPTGSAWRTVNVAFDGGGIGGGPWYAPRLAFFSVALDTEGRLIEIDNIRVNSADGRNVLGNGDFAQGRERWFFTSDRHHLPWHIKNLALHLVFDQGILGLFLFVMLVGGALWRLIAGRARANAAAPFLAAALVGFLAVGAFDSLLDVPRVAFLFYLLVLVSLVLPEGRGMDSPSP